MELSLLPPPGANKKTISLSKGKNSMKFATIDNNTSQNNRPAIFM